MPGYRPLSPEQRADHIETLIMLGRLVVALPTQLVLLRRFVVMTDEGANLHCLTSKGY